MEHSYAQILLPLPVCLQAITEVLVEELPVIHALVLQQDETRAYLPADPCDAYIEAIRQTRQSTTKLIFIGPDSIPNPRTALGLPDPWSLEHLDMRAWMLAQWPIIATNPDPVDSESFFTTVAINARMCSQNADSLLICHITEYPTLHQTILSTQPLALEKAPPTPLRFELWPIKPLHLYFALGETPFYAGFFEQNRQDPYAELPDAGRLAKHLLQRTRDILEQNGKALKIPPARLQAALTFARKLAAHDEQLMPDLFDWVTAAKGTLGDEFAAKLLEYAQTYPFDPEPGPQLRIGLDKIRTPLETTSQHAWNILRDIPRSIQVIKLRRNPKPEDAQTWKHSWDQSKSCSHLPEDLRIERFNSHARAQTLRSLQSRNTRSAPFSSSLLDGIDLRKTIRHWHTGALWVNEMPPQRGKLDTVIILFDEDHDERYPHRCTWYAEHEQESTLSFYSTDPFADMIGPGIARARYGGLAMIFPPRHIPDLFHIPAPEGLSASEQLAYASMLYSQERLVAYIAEYRPGVRIRELARHLGKHLVWTPLRHFKMETLENLRTFHILNGTEIRTIASRFIGY
jgi:hypothetical protein